MNTEVERGRRRLASPPGPVFMGPGLRRDDYLPRMGQRLGDQLAAVVDPIERDEAAHSGALAGAEQGFVEGPKPVAKGLEAVRLTDFEDHVLDRFARSVGGEGREPGVEVAERLGLLGVRRALPQRAGDEIAEVSEG